jgi:hypothetical protein
LAILHSSSFVILSVHFIFIICLKHLFINICNLLVIWSVIFQVSQAYNCALVGTNTRFDAIPRLVAYKHQEYIPVVFTP